MKIDPYNVKLRAWGFIDPKNGKECLEIRLGVNEKNFAFQSEGPITKETISAGLRSLAYMLDKEEEKENG